MSTVKRIPDRSRYSADQRLDFLVRRAAREQLLDREREHRDPDRGRLGVDEADPVALVRGGERGALERARELRGDVERVDPLVAGERVVDGEEVLRRRLRGRRQLRRRLQPVVEVVRVELDVVAEALLAEADVERDDAHVREADLGVGEVGRRVEHDRRVLAGQVHPATFASPARRIAPTITSSSWSLRRQSIAPAAQQRVELTGARRCGQADDGHLRILAHERQRRLDAVHPRQPEVHHDDVRAKLAVGADGGVPLGDRADDLDPVLELEQEDQRLPEDVVVLDEQDTDRLGLVRHGQTLSPTRRRGAAGSGAGRRAGRRARPPDAAPRAGAAGRRDRARRRR